MDREQQGWTEERIAGLIAEFRPPPASWVRAAAELPAARRSLDDLVMRAESDASLRAEILTELEAALERAGHAPDATGRGILRVRLTIVAGEEG